MFNGLCHIFLHFMVRKSKMVRNHCNIICITTSPKRRETVLKDKKTKTNIGLKIAK